MTESESVALPLGDAAFIHNAYYNRYSTLCQYPFLKKSVIFRFFISFPTVAFLVIHIRVLVRARVIWALCPSGCQNLPFLHLKSWFSPCVTWLFRVLWPPPISCARVLLHHKILIKITNKNTIYCGILLIDKDLKVWYTIQASTKSEVF